MRGLKRISSNNFVATPLSHPLRVRGLKLISGSLGFTAWKSHPLRVRGLKQEAVSDEVVVEPVASFTGAWIETVLTRSRRFRR